MSKGEDLIGQVFRRLTVISRGENKNNRVYWNCRCSCGEEVSVRANNLKSGNTKSCGCLQRDSIAKVGSSTRTHGMSNRSREYLTWKGMKARCTNPNLANYKNYGGRGITVCRRWDKFENFYNDMGVRSEGKSIDRINNDKGYTPDNCRWVTRKEQANNRRIPAR